VFRITSVNKCEFRSNTAASQPLETLAEGGTSQKETAVQQTLRPYVTAGIAIVGSGLIAATPVATPLANVQLSRDVALTSGLGDLVGPWADVFNATSENITQLTNNFDRTHLQRVRPVRGVPAVPGQPGRLLGHDAQ